MSQSFALSQHLAEFKAHGFTVFPQFYDTELIQRWRDKFDEMQQDGIASSGRASWWYADMCEHAPRIMLPAVAHPVMLDFAEMVLGPFVQLDNLTLAGFPSVSPAEVKGISGWHRDRWGQVPPTEAYLRPNAINAISYLQDLTEEYGPLRIIPGSHRKAITLQPEECTQPHPDEQVVHMKAGDVVVVHNALLHSGTPNTSGHTRYFFSVYYNLTWLKHTDNHSGPNIQQLIQQSRARNDHRMLRLFGVDDHLQARANSGFVEPDEPRWAEWAAADKVAVKEEVP
ncbi:MAG TPA: phytanoyl-CoA dioxygenase family protein [Abditibacteriaceae bacterium]|nr:phytanoyl-CoA dioxygenase family protein [Abditibacteriaceae bacterium]